MTHKDYKAIALVIKVNRSNFDDICDADKAAERVARNIAVDLATVLKRENPRFDKTRFLEACAIVE